MPQYIFRLREETILHGETYGPGWYFFDEASYVYGPFIDKDDATKALNEYCEYLEGKHDESISQRP